jgi:hypothetical protein
MRNTRTTAAATALAVAICTLGTTGCATRGTGANYSPIVDRPGPAYMQDLADCQAHATKVMDAAQGAAAGAIAGAIFGALLGAAAGGNNRFNQQMAGIGAVSGAANAAGSAEGGQRGIITRCLSGRGYSVLQ